MSGFDPRFDFAGVSSIRDGIVPAPGNIDGPTNVLHADGTWGPWVEIPPGPPPPSPGPALNQWACNAAGFIVYDLCYKLVKSAVDSGFFERAIDAILAFSFDSLAEILIPLELVDSAFLTFLENWVATAITPFVATIGAHLLDQVLWSKFHCFLYNEIASAGLVSNSVLLAAGLALAASSISPSQVTNAVALILQQFGVMSIGPVPASAFVQDYDCSNCASMSTSTAPIPIQPAFDLVVTDGTTTASFIDKLQLNHSTVSQSEGTATLTPEVGVSLNGTSVGVEPNLDLVDSLGLTWTVTDDPGGQRVLISGTPTASGTVTNVTATSPLASSGGATPDISLTGIVDAAHGGLGIDTSAFVKGTILANTGSAWEGDAPASDGLVLTADSTQPAGVSWAVPGSVSAAGPWYTVIAPPALSHWTQVNPGSTSYADVVGGVAIDTVSEAQNMRMLMRSKSQPYDLLTGFVPFQLGGAGTPALGLVLRDSSTGHLKRFALYDNAGISNNTQVGTFSAPNAGVANQFLNTTITGATVYSWPPVWLRIHNDGTHRTYFFSRDGGRWVQLFQEAFNDYISEDQVGFFADSGGSGFPCGITLISWSGA
jgi:hypothetical protein